MSPSAEGTGLRSTALAVVGAALVVLGLVLTFASSRDLGAPDRAVPVSSSGVHQDSHPCYHQDALLASLERLFHLTPLAHPWAVPPPSGRVIPGCS